MTMTYRLLCALLLASQSCQGVRNENHHRTLEWQITHDYPSEAGRIDKSEPAMSQEDFSPSDHEILQPVLEDISGRNEGRTNRPGRQMGQMANAKTKRPGMMMKSTNVLKRHPKQQKSSSAPDVKSGRLGPTISPYPTVSPTISPKPSVSAEPSSSPTISPMPTVTAPPSSSPTISPQTAITPKSSTAPVLTSAAVDELRDSPTTPSPTSPTTPSPTSPPLVKSTMNKFAVSYELGPGATPTEENFENLYKETGEYLDIHFKEHFSNVPDVDFVDSSMVKWFEPRPLIVDYDLTSYFNGSGTIPSVELIDSMISYAFTERSEYYIKHLEGALHPDNPFKSTKSITFSTYWSALANNISKVESEEATTEGSNSSATFAAPIAAIGGMLLVIAGVFALKRHKQKVAADRQKGDSRWDENGANLHLNNEKDELILDSSASAVGHSYVPHVDDEAVEDLQQQGDEGVRMVDASTTKSPSQVMRDMNLASAMEDVDLNDELDEIEEASHRSVSNRSQGSGGAKGKEDL